MEVADVRQLPIQNRGDPEALFVKQELFLGGSPTHAPDVVDAGVDTVSLEQSVRAVRDLCRSFRNVDTKRAPFLLLKEQI